MGNKVNSDLLKGLAIIAVVAIHSFSKTISSTPVNLFVDQLSRFAVPLFMALSGYGLTLSFSKNNNLIRFYVKRVWKILPWFLAASVLILIYKNYFERGTFDFFNYHTWTMIMRGGAEYHLYFVPNICNSTLFSRCYFSLLKGFLKRLYFWPCSGKSIGTGVSPQEPKFWVTIIKSGPTRCNMLPSKPGFFILFSVFIWRLNP